MRRRAGANSVIVAALTVSVATSAYAQTKSEPQIQAYGSRIGDREEDPNGAGTNGERRVSLRLNSRIASRLNSRLERFFMPVMDDQSRDAPKVDDGTRGSEKP